MSFGSPKVTTQQKRLADSQEERERQLRVDQAKQENRQFEDQVAFRRRLRGVFSLLSSGFKGFSK